MSKLQVKTNWDLTPLFKDEKDPNIDQQRQLIEQKASEFVKKWKDRTDYLEDPKVLKQALEDYEDWNRSYAYGSTESYFFELKNLLDQSDPVIQGKLNQVQEFATKLENNLQFFTLNLAKIPIEKQQEFLSDPILEPYKHFLEKLFRQSKYLLSEPEEKILNLKYLPSHIHWVQMTSKFLAKEEGPVLDEDSKKKLMNFSQILSLLSSKNKKSRDSAAKAFNDILQKYVEVAESEINAILGNKKIDDELRKIPRPDLGRHLSDDIESEVVDALLSSVSKRFEISQKFYNLKAKLFGVKKLKYHERNVEYGDIEKEYAFEQAVNLVGKVFSDLDPKFNEIFLSFIENGQLDVYPQKGKRGGAACYHALFIHPTYIFMNYTNKLNDVLTMAHELGHGINNELIREAQNPLNFETPLSTAEVASTFMEDFVLDEILKTADDETKLAILMVKLNTDVSTIQRQVACYLFEKELHQIFRQKGYLSKDEIGIIFQKHMQSYMGKSVEQPQESQNWWVYWNHIRTFFYVYSYASGLLISKSLQNQVRKNPVFIDKVKKFLSKGISDSPKNIFADLGIDITAEKFWQQGLNEEERHLSEATNLAKKLGKI